MEPEITKMVETAIDSPQTSPPEAVMITLLYSILEELISIREATETEALEDAEPDPYQTLNGPSQ